MTAHRMAAVDAQFYWMSAKVPSDEFLLYAFDGEPADFGAAIDEVCRRARACPELTMRVRRRKSADLSAVGAGGRSAASRWSATTWTTAAGTAAWRPSSASPIDQLDIRRMPWRLHVFTPVLRHSGRRRPGHRCGPAGSARAGRRRPRFGDGGLALRPGDPGARGAAVAGGLSALAGRSTRPAPIAGWFATPARGCWRPGIGLPAAAAHQCPPGRRPLGAHAGAPPLADAGPHRHRRGAGRGVHRTVRSARRCGRFAGRRGADGQTRCATCA